MTRSARLAALIAAPVALLLGTAPVGAETAVDGLPAKIYDQAVAGITPEMIKECEVMALQAIAGEAYRGAGVEWLSKMEAGETGRRISGTWADRVGRTEASVAALDTSYLVAITGKVQVRPNEGNAFAAIPVCWFDFAEGDKAPVLRTATLRK